jgi:hypothetical protein
MKLAALDPVFVTTDVGDSRGYHHTRYGESAQGIEFDCPCSASGDGACPPGPGGRLLCWFSNPIGGGSPARADWQPVARWHVVGGCTVNDLTLAPSINVPGVWHGYVIAGEVKPA